LSVHSSRCSPLFPYTTLFRSVVGVEAAVFDRDDAVLEVLGDLFQRYRLPVLIRQQSKQMTVRGVDPRRRRRGEFIDGALIRQDLDRKSTRLNSSHQIISYAVF